MNLRQRLCDRGVRLVPTARYADGQDAAFSWQTVELSDSRCDLTHPLTVLARIWFPIARGHIMVPRSHSRIQWHTPPHVAVHEFDLVTEGRATRVTDDDRIIASLYPPPGWTVRNGGPAAAIALTDRILRP